MNDIKQPPLCIDLDGTLVLSDTLMESIVALLKKNFLYVFWLPIWLLSGRAYMKKQIATRVKIRIDLLPYNKPFLEFLKSEHQKGRSLILASGTDEIIANDIAQYLGLFQTVHASNGNTNFTGHRKKDKLLNLYGEKGFDYAGNAPIDLAIWKVCHQAIVVHSKPSFIQKIKTFAQVAQVFSAPQPKFRDTLKTIRVHQWVKNILIFVPLITAHAWTMSSIGKIALAFLSFSLAASSIYIFNDFFDLESDRQHHIKQYRSLASGVLSIPVGAFIMSLLLFSSLSIASFLKLNFLGMLLIYIFINIAYSSYLKTKLLMDVILLASLYTIRILSGAVAIAVPVSSWLLAFSMFIFFSLAFIKRYSELYNLKQQGQTNSSGRSYVTDDLNHIGHLGATSGYISVLVFALYIHSNNVADLYYRPELLWLICPLLFYWISRIWLLTYRGHMNEDPVIFALHDKVSYLLGLLSAVFIFLAGPK